MLSNEEIERLNQFCVEHKVEYYDVRLELVDHLASSIETMMEGSPSLSFDGALNKVYQQFGYNGFSGIATAKEKEMRADYVHQVWGLYKSYFTLPKVAFTAMLFSGLCALQFYLTITELKWVILVSLILLSVKDFQTFFIFRKRALLKDKPLLMLRWARTFPMSAVMLFNVLNFLNFISRGYMTSGYGIYVYNGFVFLFTLGVVLSLSKADVAQKMSGNARHLYPEAFA